MRIWDMARISMNNYQARRRESAPAQPNGSLPPAGHVNPFEDPHMNITGKRPEEWQKIVPVDGAVADKLRALVKEDFTKRYGMCGTGAQADAQANIIKDYIAGLPGKERLSAVYSCEQLALKEAEKLAGKIREQIPGWEYGQPFDPGILEEASGNRLDMRI